MTTKEMFQIKFNKITVALFLQTTGTSLIIYQKAILFLLENFTCKF